MMRRRSLVLIGAILLAACTAAPTATVTPPLATATAQVSTPTATLPPTATASLTRTATRTRPPTATPTVTPTATKTFDPQATVVTVTPAPAETCHPTGTTADLTLDFLTITDEYRTRAAIDERTQDELSYLNATGPVTLLGAVAAGGWREGVEYVYTDLTNDGVPEVVLDYVALNVFGCRAGLYELLLQVTPADYLSPSILALADLNRDGLSELVIGNTPCGIHGCLDVTVWSWDGANFEDLVGGEPLFQTGNPSPFPEVRVEDVDGDGFLELLLSGNIPYNFDYDYYGPWRVNTDVYSWNGELFTLRESYYSAPEYRFQALQDADREMDAGDYVAAQAGYNAVINDAALDWWSPAKQENWIAVRMATHGTDPSPTPLPGDGGLERTQLSAYAYFRLMLLHLLQAQPAEAETVYATLQTEYPIGSAGHPYAEMGAAFWQAYTADQTVAAGCAAAVGYATAHPDTLTPLGSDYHGWQSPTYTPEMVCPPAIIPTPNRTKVISFRL